MMSHLRTGILYITYITFYLTTMNTTPGYFERKQKKKYKQQPKEFLGCSNSPLTYYIYLANLSDSSVYGRADNIKFKVSWYVANVSHALR